ncbi:MAG: glycogen synthase GlgA [Deltaproteobacteria bacterium]|nr:glycogen synthase GlgA [Deltaproteobacteria bacterium]
MKILFASSEAVPFAKTGGLADVSGALPRALARMGHEVTLILPKYHQINEKRFSLAREEVLLKVPIAQRTETAEVYSVKLAPNFQALLIRHDAYYNREQLYGTLNGDFEDNAERFIFFSRSILEAASALNLQPDVIQCNDWQTGLTPVYLKNSYRNVSTLKKTVSVFTIHNLGYQGLFWHYDMPMTNLGWELFSPQALEFYGKINFLKGGIVFSDAVTTVSRKYMEEIQTPEFGGGLEGVLRDRRQDLYGILNGVDYAEWSPEIDLFIKQKYGPADLPGKKECKADLQREFGLAGNEEIPLIGIISRLAEQKGFDLIAAIAEELMKLGIQIVVLGTGEEKYHLLFRKLKEEFPRQVGLKIAFDNGLAHKIEAGADMFLMPSRYEPCGLNQIYSLKYGTVPIVRATGGLDDTIHDFNPITGEGNGFKFVDYSAACLLETIKRALLVYRNQAAWKKLMIQGMSVDFSWERSARDYLQVYQETIDKKKRRAAAE